MARRKLQPRKLDRSPLLASEDEKRARVDALRSAFLAWFETVPGAEWEEADTEGMLLYCRWWVNADHPEWGKIFCAHHLGRNLIELQRIVDARDPGYLPQGAEWAILGLTPVDVTRERVIEAYRRQGETAKNERERRLGTAAYGRILNELYFREHSEYFP